MNARVPKEWNELSKSAQRKLAEFCISLINEQEKRDMRIVLELIIKMICCLLYDTEGFDETKLFLFVGNFKMVFNEQQKLVSKGEQRKFLDGRMEKIFPTLGFPQDFLDSLIGVADAESLEKDALKKTLEALI